MDENVSILEQVSQKEMALKAEYQAASRKAEEMVDIARKQAEEIEIRAESEGKGIAAEYRRNEMASAQIQSEEIRKRGEEEVRKVREIGKTRFREAVDRIVRGVSAGQ